MAAAWGVADAVWQTQINGKSGQRTVETDDGSHSFRQADMTQIYYNQILSPPFYVATIPFQSENCNKSF